MGCTISVIVSVYNDPIEYFEKAVRSIHNQTYKDWEMIIINDGDNQNDILYRQCIEKFHDDRIIYVTNKINQGISVCLNQALNMSSGKFIAKMDSDDISLPTRLEKQVNYFKSHPKCNVLGTYAISFGDVHDYMIDYNNYSKSMRSVLLMFRNSGLIHPSAMIRKDFLEENKITYDEHFRKALDYRLWVECTKYSKINCLNEILFLYRRHPSQISTFGKESQDSYRDEIRILQLKKLISSFCEDEKKLHLRLCNRNIIKSDVKRLYDWCTCLINENRQKKIYNHFLFKGILFSESLIAIYKLKGELEFKEFIKNVFHFISIECFFVLIFNKSINIWNNLKKRVLPIYKKREFQNLNLYI